jgi:catechol 2,3-dioxygenase-like lactoylglutathione lyase family enzyme
MELKDHNVTIMVKDMDRSIKFYESIGLKLKNRWDDHYAMMSGGGLTIGIHPAKDEPVSSGTLSIGFMISKASEASELLKSLGIEHKVEDDGASGIYAHFKDPDGTIIYFVEPKW